MRGFQLLPPAPHLCQECAIDHAPEMPHNRDSLYYQVKFNMENGRTPTWKDAMAHCTQAMQKAWTAELTKQGIATTAASSVRTLKKAPTF